MNISLNSLAYEHYAVGFDGIINRLMLINDENAKKNTGYPPYNIAKVDDTKYYIEIAVAGFTEDRLELTLEDSVLTVSGNTSIHEDTNHYIHRGIAARSFVRTFTLADNIVITGASLKNGMLSIDLLHEVVDEKKKIKIPISSYSLQPNNPEYLVE